LLCRRLLLGVRLALCHRLAPTSALLLAARQRRAGGPGVPLAILYFAHAPLHYSPHQTIHIAV
jgi:hypothetical protein